MRLIDADLITADSKIIEVITFFLKYCHAKHSNSCIAPSCEECIARFFGRQNAYLTPTVDLDSLVKQGKWIPADYGYYHCSWCGYEQDERETVTPYCPNCGAIMGGQRG